MENKSKLIVNQMNNPSFADAHFAASCGVLTQTVINNTDKDLVHLYGRQQKHVDFILLPHCIFF